LCSSGNACLCLYLVATHLNSIHTLILSENIEKIGTVKPNSSILCSNIPIFLAKICENAEQDMRLMDKETDKILFLTKKEVYEHILNGKISDGMSLSALMLYFAKVDSEALNHTI
ncbi:hypothetical protein, partial [Psychrobacter celer]|uniref:hypothetical protein n=2 Tax=Psychrobacter celer TaxID=306572 RepID=UPI001B7D3DE5